MTPVTAQWIANAVGGVLVADVDIPVTSVEKDSRDVTPGALYVGFIGERVDGHDFVSEATERGAVLSLVSQSVDAPHIMVDDVVEALGRLARAYLADRRLRGELTVIGVTGSNGKTTTKDLLAQILPDVVAPEGSFNNEIGLPLTVLKVEVTTRFLVLEMGASGPGHIAYLTAIAPLDIAAVLTVGTAHMGQYASIDQVAQAKAEIISGLIPGGVAILNADDSRVAAMVQRAPRAVTFGVDRGDVAARDVTLVGGRARLRLDVAGEVSEAFGLGLVGEHHVTNALAAAAVALECGIALADLPDRLAAAGPVSAHRMAVTRLAGGATIVDDSYNASPESMRAALRALLAVADGGRTFAVLGEMLEMGDASLSAHLDIGLDVVRLGIDHLLVVGEGAKPIFDSAVREGSWGEEAAYVATIGEARAFLDGRLVAGDTLLVKASHGAGLWKLANQLVGVDE